MGAICNKEQDALPQLNAAVPVQNSAATVLKAVVLLTVGPVGDEDRDASRVLLQRPPTKGPQLTEHAWREKLDDAVFRVTRLGATEPRGITVEFGGFDDFWGDGTYECACCGAELYDSKFKFDCNCGWPGFYNCNENSVFAVQDKDGIRTEIRCVSCDSHIGHITLGEGFNNPPPNQRHCVNSSAISFCARSGGERSACGYRGPVFMFTGRAPGEVTHTQIHVACLISGMYMHP